MANILSQFVQSEEERKRLQTIEQLRRRGHSFIRVRYAGDIIPRIDSEGNVYNIRPHGLKDLEAFEQTDISTGKTDWKTRPSAKPMAFKPDATGDIVADIWDDEDEYNRHFIFTHPELEVVDSKLAEEIKGLEGKPFKVELSAKEELEREIATKQKELEKLKERQPKEEPKQRGRKVANGVNKSAHNVDMSGVSRVAAGRVGEGGIAPVQPRTQVIEPE